MEHFSNYMDEIKENMKNKIKTQHPAWKIDDKFTIYNTIIPIAEGVVFKSKFKLKKKKRTSVIFEQEFNNRKVRYYFSEYDIIRTLIYIYDKFIDEGNYICEKMIALINDNGDDVEFGLNNKRYKFKGIGYISENKEFLTNMDYWLGINDFIFLLNLVIEKDRYKEMNENAKKTILKYLLFLFLCSERKEDMPKTKLINILKDKHIYTGLKLRSYKDVINKIGRGKLYLDISLSEEILWYNK
ncbi:hypothetical protein FC905_01040 [Clostridium botulinum]|nr:hypothetical protein [Clostridium botulinum]